MSVGTPLMCDTRDPYTMYEKRPAENKNLRETLVRNSYEEADAMLLLTDEDGYDVLINENAIIMATWDDKRELTAVTCGSPDPWIWVKETPEEIYGRSIGVQAYEDEGCDGCYWEGDKDTNPDAPCTFCVRENEDAVDDHYEPDQENEPEHGEEIHVSGVPYAVPLAAIRRHEND